MLNASHTSPLIDWMSQFITQKRLQLIDQILVNRTRHFTAVLENIYQPHNASAVLRSCDIFGIQDVHIIEDTNEYQINPEVAMGASRWLTLHRYGEWAEDGTPIPHAPGEPSGTQSCISRLKADGYTVVATSLRPGATSLYDVPIDRPLAL